MTTDALIQAKKAGQIPTLADIADLNLCDLGIAINYGVTKVKAPITDSFYIERGKTWRLFNIEDPCRVSIILTKSNLDSLRPKLEHYHHQIDYYPAHYFKNQRSPLYGLMLYCGYLDWVVDIRLLDFNFSYGKITVNNIACDISHSGGSGNDEYASVDYADGWNLVGKYALPAIKAILATGRREKQQN